MFNWSAYGEFKKRVKAAHFLNPMTEAMGLDILSGENSEKTMNEHLGDISPLLLQSDASPFDDVEDNMKNKINFLISEHGKPVGFDPQKELNILIMGEPGTGKTSLANYIIAPQAMKQGIKVWFFVKARDTERLTRLNFDFVFVDFDDSCKIRLNPKKPPRNVSREEWESKLWDIFIQSEAVYDGTKNFLIEQSALLSREYKKFGIEPSFFELYDFIKSKDFPRASRNYYYSESALNRISGMLNSPLGKILDCSDDCFEGLVHENVIFYIGGLPATQQVNMVNTLTSKLFTYKNNNDCDEMHFIIVDDAMTLFDANYEKRPDRGTPVMNNHLVEVRKAKIRIIVLGQFPSLMGNGIFASSSIKIMFTLSDSRDADKMLDSMGVKDEEQMDFGKHIGKEGREVIVKLSSRHNKAFFGRVPIIPDMEKLDQIEISKEEKQRCNERHIGLLEAIKPRKPYSETIQLIDSKEQELEKKELGLAKDILNDIYYRPFVSSTDRAIDFKLSNEKAKRLYRYIENSQFAEPVFLNLSGRGGQSKFFWISDKGNSFIQKPAKKEYSGGKGKEHIFTQLYLQDILNKKGYGEIEIEKEIEGKKIDLFCIKDEKRIGIEICVSTFKTEYLNVIKDRGKCDRIILLCLDKDARERLLDNLGSLKESVEVYILHEFLKGA